MTIAMDYCPPNYLATGSFDGLTVVWNTDTERVVAQFRSLAKKSHQLLTSAKVNRHSSKSSASRASTPHPLSTPSRPASRRLSSYRLKSASSSHLHHMPVDKVVFLKKRVKSRTRGQGTLVPSEGGCAFIWDMFSSGPPIGWFPMTDQEGEVVMALAVDDSCQRLLAGDTAGYLHLFLIEHYCTPHHPDEETVKAELSWQGHSSEILGVVWAGPSLIVSASADHSLIMWTTDGQSVGCFGQPQTSSSPASASSNLSLQTSTIEGSGKEGGSELEVKPEVVEMKHTPLDSPSDIPQEKVLGKDYQVGVRQRMAGRLERRTHFSAVDTTAISRVPAQFSPFQALQVMDIGDVDIPLDINTALRSTS